MDNWGPRIAFLALGLAVGLILGLVLQAPPVFAGLAGLAERMLRELGLRHMLALLAAVAALPLYLELRRWTAHYKAAPTQRVGFTRHWGGLGGGEGGWEVDTASLGLGLRSLVFLFLCALCATLLLSAPTPTRPEESATKSASAAPATTRSTAVADAGAPSP